LKLFSLLPAFSAIVGVETLWRSLFEGTCDLTLVVQPLRTIQIEMTYLPPPQDGMNAAFANLPGI
jgi:hypothetical protein